MTPWLAIVGIGEDGAEGLSARARALITGAGLVVGGARHLALAAPLVHGETLPWPSPLRDAFPAILARSGTPVAVLASGDPNFFGIAATLRDIVPAVETVCVPAPSAAALACARLGWALQEVDTVSACGRPLEAVLPPLQSGRRVLLLSNDATTPAALAALLRARGLGAARLTVMEALGGPRERVRSVASGEMMPEQIDPLNLVAIEPPGGEFPVRVPGLAESWFEHDGQITKWEVRAMTLAALAPRAGELLWDIGCGSGSVAIEWARAHHSNRAIAVEERADRAERARRNAAALGVPGVQIVIGAAPAVLADLAAPDAVFVGGGARDAGVLETAWRALRPNGRCVVNAVTIETQTLLAEMQARWGGMLTRIAIERLDRIGGELRGFRPAMAVVQWAATKL